MNISPTQRTVIETAIYLTSATVLWRGRNIALKDPLTRGYASIAASHIAMSALIRFGGRVPAERNDRIWQNILGIGFASLGALGLKRLLAENSSIKLDGRAILGTAVGSTALGTLFNCTTREPSEELPQPNSPLLEAIQELPGPRIELDMISSLEDIRAMELSEQEYQEAYEQHYSQEPPVRPDTPVLGYFELQDDEFLSADETPQEIIEESKEPPRASNIAPQKKSRRRK